MLLPTYCQPSTPGLCQWTLTALFLYYSVPAVVAAAVVEIDATDVPYRVPSSSSVKVVLSANLLMVFSKATWHVLMVARMQ